MGVHHAWGRTYKDLYQRFHAMLGEDQRWQNGFDCQGLWVEVNVERELGYTSKRDIERNGIAGFVSLCKQRVLTYAAQQTEQSIRLGMWMSPGGYVRCAVTGREIPLDELKYWSVELQEAYADAATSLKRHQETARELTRAVCGVSAKARRRSLAERARDHLADGVAGSRIRGQPERPRRARAACRAPCRCRRGGRSPSRW